MVDITGELIVIVLLIFANGVFALSEIAVVSSRKSKLKVMADRGSRKARKALELAQEPGEFLSTIQISITLIGILAGVYGGATIAKDLQSALEAYAMLKPHSHTISLAVVVIGITYFTLIIGELVPKRLALQNPERIAALVAMPIYYISILVHPFVRILDASSGIVIRMLGLKKPVYDVSEDEIKAMLAEGAEAGIFHKMEQDICHRALRMDDLSVHDIMTPRPDIVWLDDAAPHEENRNKILKSCHTVFPVCKGGLDEVVGILHVKDMLKVYPEIEALDIRSLLHQPVVFPETVSLMQIIDHFKSSPIRIALVVDEYGVIQGVVTEDDVVKALVGDMPALRGAEDPVIVEREDGSWLVDGTIPIDAFQQHFNIADMRGDREEDYHTLGGFIMTHLGRIPVTGDRLKWDRYRFEVVDMDGNRVDKVLFMQHLPPDDPVASLKDSSEM
ncbi:MAG: HlyC/CorC family transporter [Deltaproteobacteria bacterium]|nr:HlyC/CorC family transporter [Deltaproteobacteria bacterium]